VQFILNSDAHVYTGIGDVSIPFAFLKEYQIPLDLVANLDKLPKLIRCRK